MREERYRPPDGRYIAAAKSTITERQTVWFSPLGAGTHAATQAITTTARPMERAQLRGRVSFDGCGDCNHHDERSLQERVAIRIRVV